MQVHVFTRPYMSLYLLAYPFMSLHVLTFTYMPWQFLTCPYMYLVHVWTCKDMASNFDEATGS